MKTLFSKKPVEKDNPFRGIWEGQPSAGKTPSSVVAQAPASPAVSKPSGATVSKPRWGVGSVIAGLIFFLGIQTIVVLAILQLVAFNGGVTSVDDAMDLTTLPAVLIASSVAMWSSWVVWMWITSRKKGTGNFFADFRLRVNWKKDVGIGFVVAVLLVAGVNGLSLLLEAFGVDLAGSDNGSAFGPGGGVAAAVMAVLIASIAGPFFEEVFFRGFVLQAVKNTILNQKDAATRMGTPSPITAWAVRHKQAIAVIASSVVFGFLHFQGVETFGQWYVVLVTGSLGAVLAMITLRYGRLGPAIFAHMFYNGGTLLLAYLTQ